MPGEMARRPSGAYSETMWILASERERQRHDDAILADRTRRLLRVSLARPIPSTVVWVYGPDPGGWLGTGWPGHAASGWFWHCLFVH